MAKTWDTVISMTEKYVGDSWYLYLLGAAFLALLFLGWKRKESRFWLVLTGVFAFLYLCPVRPGSL